MAERAQKTDSTSHAAAVENLRQFRERQSAERERLTAALATAEREYKKWLTPKQRFEKAKSELLTFEVADSKDHAAMQCAVEAAAPAIVRETFTEVGRQRERSGLQFQTFGNTHNGELIAKLNAALEQARDELRHLLETPVDDANAAVRAI